MIQPDYTSAVRHLSSVYGFQDEFNDRASFMIDNKYRLDIDKFGSHFFTYKLLEFPSGLIVEEGLINETVYSREELFEGFDVQDPKEYIAALEEYYTSHGAEFTYSEKQSIFEESLRLRKESLEHPTYWWWLGTDI